MGPFSRQVTHCSPSWRFSASRQLFSWRRWAHIQLEPLRVCGGASARKAAAAAGLRLGAVLGSCPVTISQVHRKHALAGRPAQQQRDC